MFPKQLDCYWVGSLDFNFLVETKVFSSTPPNSETLFARGGRCNQERWTLRAGSAEDPFLQEIKVALEQLRRVGGSGVARGAGVGLLEVRRLCFSFFFSKREGSLRVLLFLPGGSFAILGA